MASNGDGSGPGGNGGIDSFLLDDDDDDIEALASKACALASVAVPDYADAIKRENKRSKAKYGNRFTIDDNDLDEDDMGEVDDEFSSSGIVLAEKTSQILSNFQDYVSGIGGVDEAGLGNAGKEILEGGNKVAAGEEMVTFVSGGGGGGGGDNNAALADLASKVRADNKERLLERKSSSSSRGSGGGGGWCKPLQREWDHEGGGGGGGGGYHAKNSIDDLNNGRNLHDPAAGIEAWESSSGDPEEFKMISRGQKYTHPWLQSRRVKLGVFNCLLVAGIVLGVSIGLKSRNDKAGQELDVKINEVEDELASKGDAQDEYGNMIGVPTNTGGLPTSQGFPTAQDDSKPASAPDSAQEMIEDAYVYQVAVNKWHPQEFNRDEGWYGESYLDAYEFCTGLPAKEGQFFDICPYDAICPFGPDSQPMGGYKEDAEGSSWIPISDYANDWAQVSRNNACVRYSAENEHPPEWGVDSSENGDVTAHVMCCISMESLEGVDPNAVVGAITEANYDEFDAFGTLSIKPGNPNFPVYLETTSKYLPLEFDRTKGWNGSSYIEALQFCGAMAGYEVCPYDAICPLGANSEPLGGYKDEIKGSWTPILDSANDWVQVSLGDPCIKYSGVHPKPPSWSITGSGSEEFTRHIMCCLLDKRAPEDDYNDSESAFADENGPGMGSAAMDEAAAAAKEAEIEAEAAANKIEVESEEEEAENQEIIDPAILAYENSARIYLPVEYDRSKGYFGQTYLEAVEFCNNSDEDYAICPLDAVCPRGSGSEPLGGFKKEAEQVWIPISDEMNDWVNVAEVNACLKFSSLNPTSPEWGVQSTPDSDIFTQNVMCCHRTDEYDKDTDLLQYESEMLYEKAAKKYKPIFADRGMGWSGRTFIDAVEFCGQQEEHSLCPYDAICPLGPDAEPLGGYKGAGPGGDDAELGESWYPLLPTEGIYGGDQWVQIGMQNACQRYSALYPASTPEWGMSGEGNEEITRNIICCAFVPDLDKLDPEIAGVIAVAEEKAEQEAEAEAEEEEAKSEVYFADEGKFLPISYAREDGWKGQTYLEAVQFCAEVEGGDYEICPFDAICPMGSNSEPLIGFETDSIPGNSWVPISDDANDWVNLSEDNSCIRYSAFFPNRPDWGETGEGNEEITRLVMCCKGTIWGEAEESFLYELMAKKYRPVWFDRSQGWAGSTYQEAAEFCPSVSDGTLNLCPYEAYCPMAGFDVPLGGVIADEPAGSWAPMNEVYNGWLSIGPDHPCEVYDLVVGGGGDAEGPEWGMFGSGNEELTRHIMCCANPTPLGEEVDAVPTMPSPTDKPPSSEAFIVSPEPTVALIIESPVATPQPTPDPTPQPTPEPTPQLTSYPTPLPTPQLTAQPTPDPTPAPTSLPSSKPTLPPISGAMGTAVEGYKNAEKYNPIWYDRSSGWMGLTYDDAFAFCSEKGSNHDICPYEVICPGGALNLPYGGAKSERDGSWAPINTPFNSWVEVGDRQTCVRYQNLNPKDHPSWGLTGEDDEDLTRHIMCCDMTGAEDGGAGGAHSEDSIALAYGEVMDRYAPKWFDRSEGWDGRTYTDAITFCASIDSYIPCPYDAYCPMGEGSLPTGGYDGTEEAWAAIMDTPNGWVQIGSYEKNSISNSCMTYNSLHDNPPLWGLLGDDNVDYTPHIMCCKEPENHFIDGMDPPGPVAVANTKNEQEVLEEMDPVWFSSKHGYHGATHQDAADFCKSIGDLVMCPKNAYCPSEAQDKVFLQRDPFAGEQWAPVANEFGKEVWISIGQSPNTCSTHEDLLLPQPEWAVDGSNQEVKDNILCCQSPKHLQKEQSLMNDLNPIWMDSSHGYEGGSHADAMAFCESFGNRKLCPYTGYCPHGPGQPVMGGHAADFNTEGEQWAPVYGQNKNHWVMIGMKYQNKATTCMTSEELEGEMPAWGMTKENAQLKKYILCCSF